MVEALCIEHELGPVDGRLGCLDCGRTHCPHCDRYYTPTLGNRKHPDMLIQNEFPEATAEQREQLVSGICSDACWNMFLGGG